MKTKTKEKVYAERQHNYKTKKEEIFKKALDSVPTTDKKKEEQKKKAQTPAFSFSVDLLKRRDLADFGESRLFFDNYYFCLKNLVRSLF